MGTVIAVVETAHAVALGELLLLASILSWGLVHVRGTTLRAPCVWALISTAMLALDALLHTASDLTGASVLHFSAAASTFCPMIAVLGAKRPQNRGWQWVVLTLWLVLVWPAGQALLFADGRRVELFVAWWIFLFGLIALGLLTYLPTRNWLPALLTATGQFLLLDFPVGRPRFVSDEWTLASGAGCFAVAALVVAARTPRSPRGITEGLAKVDWRWRRFRDTYGALWALRILGRINQTAEICDWPIRLTWSRFASADTQPPAPLSTEELAQVEQTLDTLLRRFERR